MGETPAMSRSVAITGACTFLGTQLLRRLEADENVRTILAFDIAPPRVSSTKTRFCNIDLTLPAAGARIAAELALHRIDTFVHGAFLSGPSHSGSWARDLEEQGTAHVISACTEQTPERLIMLSTTLVYGAQPDNPSLLTESAPLRDDSPSAFLRSRVRAERLIREFAERQSKTGVVVLRFAPLLGPTADNFFSDFFSRPVAPVLMGFDPLIQLIHEHDAARALLAVVEKRSVIGAFNIVGEGVMPYTSVLALMGKLRCPLPMFIARPFARAMWATQLSAAPPSLLDFLRYTCVADGRAARQTLGFAADYSIQRTIFDFLGVGDGEVDVREVYG